MSPSGKPVLGQNSILVPSKQKSGALLIKQTQLFNVSHIYVYQTSRISIKVVTRSQARNVYSRSNTWIIGSNTTRSMDVYLRLFCLCSPVYVEALRLADPAFKGSNQLSGRYRHFRINSEWEQAESVKVEEQEKTRIR
jgi:hypothetical protein